MRYVAYKKTIVKVVDTAIQDQDTIKDLFRLIKEKELICSLRLVDYPKFKIVRIDKVEDDGIVFQASKDRSATLKKRATFDQIAYLELITEDQVLNSLKPDINRWNLLSPADNIEDEEKIND